MKKLDGNGNKHSVVSNGSQFGPILLSSGRGCLIKYVQTDDRLSSRMNPVTIHDPKDILRTTCNIVAP